MGKEIMNIKKNGKLVALDTCWSYWVLGDVLYSVSVTGDNYNIWCGLSRLNFHLHRLFQVTGKRFFTETPSMTVIDKNFISQFSFA